MSIAEWIVSIMGGIFCLFILVIFIGIIISSILDPSRPNNINPKNGVLYKRLHSMNVGLGDDIALQRKYQSAVSGIPHPIEKGLRSYYCPRCGETLGSGKIKEVWNGIDDVISKHWSFIYYNCAKCDYEYGKWI